MKTPFQSLFVIHLAFVFLLSGCAGMTDDSFLKDVFTHEPTEELTEDDPRYLQVNYLGRFLLDADEHRKFVALAKNEDVMKSWNAAHLSTGAEMATDLAVGELGSSLGSSIGVGVLLASGVLNAIFDGSHDYASFIALPSEFDGKTLSTAEEAHAAAMMLVHRQVQHVATALGDWDLRCVKGCDSSHQHWQFEQKTGASLNENYIYQPEKILLMLGIRELAQEEANSPLSAFIDENIAWTSKSANGFYLGLYEPLEFDASGLATLTLNEEHGLEFVTKAHNILNTHIGRDIVRTLHSTPYTLWGTTTGSNRVFFNGEMYKGATRFDDIVTEPNLLIANVE